MIWPDGSTQDGLLGGQNTNGYRDPDISEELGILRQLNVDQGMAPRPARNQARLDIAPILARTRHTRNLRARSRASMRARRTL